MEKRGSLQSEIERVSKEFLERSKDKEVQIISHFDTDGITAATIMIKTLTKLDRKFCVRIVKNLEKKDIEKLCPNKINLFLDLCSNSLNYIEESDLKEVFIIDHHEIVQKIPEKVQIINSELCEKEKISASGLTYLFAKAIDSSNKEFAKLAVLGMIGDRLEKEIDKLNHDILKDGEVVKKRGLLIYPSTRPLNRSLEYSSNPYIPEVTGNIKGVLELLREVGLNPKNGKYPSIIELKEEEMSKLITSILLRNKKIKSEDIVGNIFLIKLFNKLEDARELSAMINACSRLGESDTAIRLCMEIPNIKKRAESIHVKYKQHLISGIKHLVDQEKIQGKGFAIMNAKYNIKDTIIGTIVSIISSSAIYEEGTTLVGMAYSDDKIKVSARNVGNIGRNVRELLAKTTEIVGGEVGGHEFAAGCLIDQEKEKEFIECLKKNLEIEMIRV